MPEFALAPITKEFFDSEDGQFVIDVIRNRWEDADARMRALFIFPDAGVYRSRLEYFRRRLSLCRQEDVDRDLAELERRAEQLSEVKSLLQTLQAEEAELASKVKEIRNRLSTADFHRKETSGGPNGDALTMLLLAPELEAAGLKR